MSDRGCILLEVRVADEPVIHWPALRRGLEEYFGALGDTPRTIWTTSPGGRHGRTRTFKWETLDKLALEPATGTISSSELRSLPLGDRPDARATFNMSLYLRHNPAIEHSQQPPASLSVVVDSSAPAHGAAPEAATAFVEHVVASLSVLHGGITRLDNLAQADCEVWGGLQSEAAAQPPLFQRRREHDWWRNGTATIWACCRRLYWTTVLGPALAQAAGGAEAARAAGAIDVREINGALMFRAMEGPPRDSLDPEFLAATVRLRRWLWPHTFQNPLDAAGFEAEVGLEPPT